MELKCRCDSRCISVCPKTLKDIQTIYDPCAQCKAWGFKKFTALEDQVNLSKIDGDFGRCNCGRRHLDIVMAQILKILIEEGFRNKKSTLRNACIPLITPAFPTKSAPYIGENSLVILSDEMDKNCAEKIINEVNEVKGVLKGSISETIGIKDVNSAVHIYELLAGCDMRCDLLPSQFGNICIYKYQGEIHIEFPRLRSPKIEKIELFLQKYDNPKVIDCTCGPGTLGIFSLKAGASKVVFNDLWYPAAKITALNLEVNGFPVDISNNKKGLIASGQNIQVYCMDIRELPSFLDEKFDICIVDTFPGVDSEDFVDAAEKLGGEVVVI